MSQSQPLARKLFALFLFIAANAAAQPKIISFNPLSGPAGTTVTLTGTGFNAMASGNTVYFGAVQAVVTGGSGTSLVVKAPAGATYQPVSVLNTATGRTGFSATPYNLTFSNPFGSGIADNFYKPAINFTTGGLPLSLVMADIDGDGKPDAVVANTSANSISILRNTSTGAMPSFAAPVSFALGSTPTDFVVADLDGDGKQDVAAVSYASSTLSVLRNTSVAGSIDAASFPAPVNFATGENPDAITAGDADGDGRPDIIVANNTSNTVSVFRNVSGAGSINAASFAPKADFATNTRPQFVRMGDIDGDGRPDIVVAQYDIQGLSILRNTSTTGAIDASSFAGKVSFDFSYPNSLDIGDLNGDGKPEIAVASGGTTTVLPNISAAGTISSASFAAGVQLDETRSHNPADGLVTIGDADGDGRPDVIVSPNNSSAIAIFRNLSAGGMITASSFAFRVDFSVGTNTATGSNKAVICDVNGDGAAELVTTFRNQIAPAASSISVLQISAPAPVLPPPTVTGFSPASGPAGTTVTISGTNFNAAPAGNKVFFGSVQAAVTGGTATSLTVTVPPGTTYQPVSVLNTATGLTAYTTAPFTTTFTNPLGTGFPPGFYQPPVGFPTNYAPSTLDVADIDGDGKTDIAVGNFTDVSILRNTSVPGSITPNSFAAKVDIGTDVTNNITLADLDGDGKPDLVAVHAVYNYITILRNASVSGSISFAEGKSPYTGKRPSTAAIGDLDGDGRPDIVVANNESGTISVLRNLSTPGNISFAPKVDYIVGQAPTSVAIGDLNGDGKPDIAVSNGGAFTISVLRNTAVKGDISAASFAAGVEFATGSNPNTIRISDFNGDGKPDLAVANSGASTISVLQNTTPAATNGFSFSRIDVVTVTNPSGITIADLDGDSKPDVLAYVPGTVSVLRNITAGNNTPASFAAKADFNAGEYGTSAVAGDLDGDGIPDIVAVNGSATTVSVLRISSPVSASGAPRIISFSPASGPVGTTVTITGNNFNASPAGNTVYFGAVRAAVTGGTATSLTVTAPAGATYQPLSVLNTANGLSGYSSLPFDATFTNFGAGIQADFYQSKTDLATPTLPFHVVLSDLDGDGRPDMVVANSSGSISLFRNTSTTGSTNAFSFGARTDLPASGDSRFIVVGDLDGDGRPEIVIANAASNTLTVLHNISVPGTLNAASFAAGVNFATGNTPYSAAIGDVDGDGKPDLVVANFADANVSVLRNTTATGNISLSSFGLRVNFPAGAYPRSVAVSDLNGDGKPDIAVVNERANTATVLRNTSTPGTVNASSFAAPVNFATGSSPDCIALSDLDGDGKTDMAVSNYGSSTVSVLRNMAAANTIDPTSFAPKTDYATGQQPFFVAAGDADGDGKPDLLTANTAPNSLSVLRNTTITGNPPSFNQQVAFASGGYPVSVALGDVDGDNIPELISANAGANSISILKPGKVPHAPLISSFSPASGPAGTQVAITGANFDTRTFGNTVYFGTEKATVTSASPTSLTVTAPAGATYRPLSVVTTGLAGYSSRPFVTTFSNPFGTGIPANFYKPKVDIATGNPSLYAVAFGDLDNDGKLDMVGVNPVTRIVSVLRNVSATGSIGAASFAPRLDLAVTGRPRDISISDIDGDGRLDIVVLNTEDNSLTVLQNNESVADNGGFTSYSFFQVNFATGTYVSSLAVGDLDGDGKPDIVLTNLYTNTLSVLRNISTINTITAASFAAKVDYAAGDYPRSVAIGDVDGDGRPDLVVANEHGNSVSVFRNQTIFNSITPASFAARVDFPAGANPPSVAVGDVDGDGRPDIVVANYGSGNVSVLRNTAAAGTVDASSFAAKADFATGLNPFHVALGDVDGDGKVDLVTANSNANTISVLRNMSVSGSIAAASFAGKVDFASSGYPLYIALGDLDGDGLPEAAAANATDGSISVFKINSPVSMTAGAAPANAMAAELPVAMQLYPNPTLGEFTLLLQGMKAQVANVEVFSESGRTVKKSMVNLNGQAFTLKLNLRSQPAGVYYVKVTGMDGVQVMKVVVQR